MAVLDNLNPPLFIVGLGIVVIAVVLPWLTSGQATDRRLRLGIGLAGLGTCVLAFLSGGVTPGADPHDHSPALTQAACVEKLSRRMASLSPAQTRATAAVPRAPPSPGDIGLVSGAATATYYAMGEDLVTLARRQGVPLFNRETQGSLENIRKLADPKENAAIGFAQSDLLAWLRHADNPRDRQAAALLRLVLPLHAEEVHVLASTALNGLADLSGRRVVTAASSQGSRHTAENLLRAHGITPARLDSDGTPAEALCHVLTGSADAMVIVAGKPTSQLVSLDALADHESRPLARVHLLPVTDPTGTDGYEPATLTAQDYGWISQPVQTLAVRALLMAFDFSPRRTPYQRLRCQQLDRLGRLLDSGLPGLQQPPQHPKWRDVDPQRSVRGWAINRCAHAASPT